jgi:hypothetical protein
MRAGATVDTLSFEVGTGSGVSVDSGTSVCGPEGIGVSGARLFTGVAIVVANDGDAIGMSVALDGKPFGVGTGVADGVPFGIGLLSITPKKAPATQTATIAAMMTPRRIMSRSIGCLRDRSEVIFDQEALHRQNLDTRRTSLSGAL